MKRRGPASVLYSWLLRLYPASFRAEYGEEMERLFGERRRDARGAGERVDLWLTELRDALASGPASHLDILRQDLRYTVRTLARQPAFTLVAVAVTALGIGANTAVFSVADHLLLRQLPFERADRLVQLWEEKLGYSYMELSPPNLRDFREAATGTDGPFEEIGAWVEREWNLTGLGEPQRVSGALVTAELFDVLRTRAVRGRLLEPEDDRPGAPGAVVLSHRFWQRELGGRSDVLGETLELDDESLTVIGILPPEFAYPSRRTDVWLPHRMGAEAYEDRNNNYLRGLARLRQDVTLAEAEAAVDALAERIGARNPELESWGARLVPLREGVARQNRLLVLALLGASACVLLLACTNLASLLMARAIGRERELGLRAALGAGRERLVRQLLTESVVLALLGGLTGVAVAVLVSPLASRLLPPSMPVAGTSVLEPRVLAFSAFLTLLTGVGFGILPAIRSGRRAARGSIATGPRVDMARRTQPLRRFLVVVEVAAAVTLVVASGLLIEALRRVASVDTGFDTEQVLTLETALPLQRYEATAERSRLYDEIVDRVEALPGVERASYISFLPLDMGGGIWPVGVGGHHDDQAPSTASLRFVTPGFFATLDIPLLTGRDVRRSDVDEPPFVAVVSESFAERYWPGQDPLGREFQFAFRDRVVVGVVGDIRVRGLERSSEPQVYLPYRQVPDGGLVFYAPRSLTVRTELDDDASRERLASAVREIVQRVDPELPVTRIRSLEEVVAEQTEARRHQIRLLGAFTVLALVLAGLGIHGLLAYSVSQRTQEIGLRLALGARRIDVAALVIRESVLIAAIGLLLGVGLAWIAGRLLQALLAGVPPTHPATLAAAVGVAVVVTVTGTLVPALRALRCEPTRALDNAG